MESSAVSLNGADSTFTDLQFVDNFASPTAGDISANDGYLATYSDPVSVTVGDTFVFKAGSWSMAGDADLNPQIVGTFSGQVFLADENGVRISNIVTVPEPASTLLLAFGACALTTRRRRES